MDSAKTEQAAEGRRDGTYFNTIGGQAAGESGVFLEKKSCLDW
jgi:hypothetical protein